jgi:hypothetical protein
MSVNVPSRDALANRQARPLTGVEVRDSIENHILTIANKLLDKVGLDSDDTLPMLDYLRESFRFSTINQTRLQKVHVTYPKVGWSIKIRIEQLEDRTTIINGRNLSHIVGGEVEVDLEKNVRLSVGFGRSGEGIVVFSVEEEKIPSNIPDKDRQKFNLPVTAEFLKPDGTVGKVDINELRSDPKERRVARRVDVGSGAPHREAKLIPSYDENGVPTNVEVMVGGGEVGELVVTPDQLPEVSLDDLVGTPPVPPELVPPTNSLPPPNSMSKISRPNVKFKRG